MTRARPNTTATPPRWDHLFVWSRKDFEPGGQQLPADEQAVVELLPRASIRQVLNRTQIPRIIAGPVVFDVLVLEILKDERPRSSWAVEVTGVVGEAARSRLSTFWGQAASCGGAVPAAVVLASTLPGATEAVLALAARMALSCTVDLILGTT